MFIIKKILTPFLLPPGIFIIALFASGVWFYFKKRLRKAGIFNLLTGVVIWFFSISPVTDVMIRGLESDFKIPENPQGDVIALLGGGANWAPDLSGRGFTNNDALGRMITAVRLQKRLWIPIVVSGGQVFKDMPSEADIMRRILTDLGVPSDKIIIEDKSRDTIENARYTKKISDAMGFKKVILVTTAHHMKRSVMSFKKAGIEVIPVPANFITWEGKKYGWESYLPDVSALRNAGSAVHEYLGLVFYSLAY
ncbi:MAG: YdcF family protein [Candidatus Brocadiaceae bacterium]|nr:YdcF family protein [Candidatus Brocadiaceae bacterium]